MRYTKGIFQGPQARRAQVWALMNKESGPGEKTEEVGRTMESQRSQGAPVWELGIVGH